MSGRGLNLSRWGRNWQLNDAVVDGVQVLDVGRIEVVGYITVESSQRDGEPCVISHEGYLQKGSLARAYENASSGSTHCFVSLLQQLSDRVFRNGRPSKGIIDTLVESP
jgi:hypothetical protein